jgi:xanthine dehydrogenase accessory factor
VNLSETAEVLARIASLREEGRQMALATIVSVRGSTYRRPGARFLVPDRGDPVGNLSGGCLEGEVEQIAHDVMNEGDSKLEMYDLTADDEVVWGWGLGCNGAIEVFIEPADRAAELADAMRAAIDEERMIAVATVVESKAPEMESGARMLLHSDGRREGSVGDERLDGVIEGLLGERLDLGEAGTGTADLDQGEGRVFVEVLVPPLRLLVCGAGHDAIPLVGQAAALGWKVMVVDDRESFLDPQRFPAAEFVKCEPIDAASTAGVDDRTYAVVMSHNYLRDRDYLKSFLSSGAAYVGMLGPKARLERLLGDLRTEGIEPSAKEMERVHGPAGLDVGGEGPEEVATAIVGEILAISRGRGAGFLHDRKGTIH